MIPDRLRRALVARDGGCVLPGCDRPPGFCDAHHLLPWSQGGKTDLADLALVCRVHHTLVHEGGYQLMRDPATGRWRLVPPARGHPTPT